MRRRLSGACQPILVGLWLLATLPEAAAAGLCSRLTVPQQLDLACTEAVSPGATAAAVIDPVDSTFSALSRMSVRALDPVADRLAWHDPAAWLEQQMIVDLDGVSQAIRDLGNDPDSPFGSEMVRSTIAMLASGLEGLSRLPLAGCDDGTVERQLTCRFGVEPVGLIVRIKLAGEDAARYAFNMRTFNEQRLRHFTAIANSFAAR